MGLRSTLVVATATTALCAAGASSAQAAESDFNGDGRSDLIVGAPGNSLHETSDGTAWALYGRSRGSLARRSQMLSQDAPGILDRNEPFDGLSAGTNGDFDGDGFADAALAVPNESIERIAGDGGRAHGAINVVFGSSRGLVPNGNQFLYRDPVRDRRAQPYEFLGASTAAGDFDGDGRDELAASVRLNPPGISGAGAVLIARGSPGGLRLGSPALTQDTRGVHGTADGSNGFGSALASGDFDGDGFADLAIGAPGEDVGGESSVGALHVLFGSARGLTGEGDAFVTEGTDGMPGPGPEFNDSFADSLEAGDFDGDGRDDVLIGAPFKEIGTDDESGAIFVVPGARRGLAPAAGRYFTRLSPGMVEVPPDGYASVFGLEIAAGDLDGDHRDDVAVGLEQEVFNDSERGGAVRVLFGSPSGVTTADSRRINGASSFIAGDGQGYNDDFGASVEFGNLTSSRGPEELLIGETQYGFPDEGFPCPGAGVLHVVFGNRGRDLGARRAQSISQETRGMVGNGDQRCDLFGDRVASG